MNILTFDIEEWFHILDNSSTKNEQDWAKYPMRIYQNMDKIFDILDNGKYKATFFCIGWIARKYPDLIKRIDKAGYEIATHSNMHQLAYEQTPQEFSNDLEESIGLLEDITGKKVRAYRAPGFSLKKENKWVFEVLAKNGIEIDCSIFPAKRAHGGFAEFGEAQACLIEIDGIRLKEFPINLYEIFGQKFVFSGGGYFRLLPYTLIDMMTKKSKYVMTYFHPRDFDADQPMIEDLSLIRKFKSYYGLSTCQDKLKKLIQSYSFVDLNEANFITDWQKAPIIKL